MSSPTGLSLKTWPMPKANVAAKLVQNRRLLRRQTIIVEIGPVLLIRSVRAFCSRERGGVPYMIGNISSRINKGTLLIDSGGLETEPKVEVNPNAVSRLRYNPEMKNMTCPTYIISRVHKIRKSVWKCLESYMNSQSN